MAPKTACDSTIVKAKDLKCLLS